MKSMDKQRGLLSKTLVIGISILFIGMSVVSSTGNVLKDNHSYFKYQVEEPASRRDNDTTPPVTTCTFEPPEPDGENGWYISVTIILHATDDLSGVKEIRYTINGGAEQTQPGDIVTIILAEDGENIWIEYWAIDNAGNVEPKNSSYIDVDATIPDVDLSYEITGWVPLKGWEYVFTAIATDAMSGMDRVEFYYNNELQETISHPGPEYTWTLIHIPLPGTAFVRATAYDKAGLFHSDDVRVSGKSQIFHILRLSEGFPLLEVLLRIINL